MKMKTAGLVVLSMFFLVSCKQDASISALGSDDITEAILDESGSIIDEEPIDKNEDIGDIVEEGEIQIDGSDEEAEIVDLPIDEEEEEIVDEEELNEEEEASLCVSRKNLVVEKLDGSGSVGSVMSYKGPLSAAMNYNYYSASAHPIVGPHPEEYEGHFFFYEGKDGLALNFFYNIDAAGSSNNQVKMEVSIKGNDQIDRVLLSDDGNEVKKISDENGVNRYAGKMHYWYNTDGGVIGPLRGENFKIHVKIYNVGDNKTVGFHSPNGKSFALETGVTSAEAYSEFVIYYDGNIKDCDSDKVSDKKLQCIKEVADSFEEEIKSSEGWRAEYSQALVNRKKMIRELIFEQKDERSQIAAKYKDALTELRIKQKAERLKLNAKHKAIRLELNAKISEEMKSCNADKEARKAGKCKALAKDLRQKRKDLNADHKEIRLALNADHKKMRTSLIDQRKASIKSFNSEAKAKRQSMAKELLVKAKKLRSELRAAHAKLMEHFQGKISSCSIN